MKFSDRVFYIEIWTRRTIRDDKIDRILTDVSDVGHFFLNGTMRKLVRVSKIEMAIFWKREESAIRRIKSLERLFPKSENVFIIKEITVSQFISLIPDELDYETNTYKKEFWSRNLDTKKKEIKRIDLANL